MGSLSCELGFQGRGRGEGEEVQEGMGRNQADRERSRARRRRERRLGVGRTTSGQYSRKLEKAGKRAEANASTIRGNSATTIPNRGAGPGKGGSTLQERRREKTLRTKTRQARTEKLCIKEASAEDRARWEGELKAYCAKIFDDLEKDTGTQERRIRVFRERGGRQKEERKTLQCTSFLEP